MLNTVTFTQVAAQSPDGHNFKMLEETGQAEWSRKYPIMFNPTEITSPDNKTGMLILQKALKSPSEAAGLSLTQVSDGSVIRTVDALYRTAITEYQSHLLLALGKDQHSIQHLQQIKKWIPLKSGGIGGLFFGFFCVAITGGGALPFFGGAAVGGGVVGLLQNRQVREDVWVEGSTGRREWFSSVNILEKRRVLETKNLISLSATKLVHELQIMRQGGEIDRRKVKELEQLKNVYVSIAEENFFVESPTVERTDVEAFLNQFKQN